MASLCCDKNGRKRILFKGADGQRHPIRLGKMPKGMALGIKTKVEALVAASITKHPLDNETAEWLAKLDGDLPDKLADVGLIPKSEKTEGETIALATFIEQYIASRPNMKPNTLKNYRATQRSLIDFFGTARLLRDVAPGDCDDWRAQQVGAGYAPATVGRNVKRAKQFFRTAVRKRLIAENPCGDLKAAAQVNKTREHFVIREDTEKIIAACPDAEWRLIVALARYGGLRTPSETFALRWSDVDWERGRIRIRSPKTAHNPGGESRMMPLFPELRPHLESVFDAAEPGTVHVIAKHRLGSANLRTQLERIMGRAGVATWPRLFQNMRASRETELTREHPLHVVVSWIGNSAPIAARHYLQVTDGDFARAIEGVPAPAGGALGAQNAAQQPIAPCGTDSQETQQALAEQGLVLSGAVACDTVQPYIVPPRGVEPLFSD